jgi:multidrug efflux pump subunit AcrB
MRKAIAYFIDNPIFSYTLIVVTAVLGLIAVVFTNKESFPETIQDMVNVNVAFPGASPLEVEEGILMPVEDAVESVVGIDKITSTAFENMGKVTIEVQPGYDPREVFNDIRDAVEQINTFPDGIERPQTNLVVKRQSVIQVVFYGDQPYEILKEKAEQVRDRLMASSGISQINIKGIPERVINIEVDEEKLRKYNLTMSSITQRIRQYNLNVTAGRLKTENYEYRLRLYGRAYWARDLNEIIIRTNEQGGTLSLSAIAKVTEGWEEDPNWLKYGYEGQNAVTLDVTKTSEEDILTVRDLVMSYIEKIKPELPETIKVDIWRDNSKNLRSRINLLTRNGTYGLILILICLGLFLNVRLAFWVAMGLPFAFLATFAIVNFTPVTINLISLFGMILVSGILVDDAIVIGENIYDMYEKGMSARDAAIEGTLQVLPAVVVSVFTTIIAFIPFFYIQGRMGSFIWHMAAIVIISLAFSLVESILIMPSHIKHSLESGRSGRHVNKLRRFLNRVLNKGMVSLFFKPVKLSLKFPVVTLVLGISLAIVTLGITNRFMQFSWFPAIDSDFIKVSIEMEPGTNEQKTAKVAEHLKKALFDLEKKYGEDLNGNRLVKSLYVTYGGSGSKKSSEYAEVALQLMLAEKRKDILIDRKLPLTSQKVFQDWRRQAGKIPGVRNLAFGKLNGRTFGAPVTVHVAGRDIDDLKQASKLVADYLAAKKGVQAVQVERYAGKDELVFNVTDKGQALGLTRSDIAQQFRQAFYGTEVLELQRGRDSVEVWLRLADIDRSSFSDIHNLRIRLANNKEIPFDEVAEYTIRPGIAKIIREDRRRLMVLTAEIDDKIVNDEELKEGMVNDLFSGVEQQFPGVKLSLAGQDVEKRKSNLSMRLAFPVALVFMVILVSLMFKSYIQGVMVLSMIPFGLTGAALGHVLIGINWTILSTIGMIGLAGIVVNDSVVLMDSINRFRKNGMGIYEACLAGAKGRIRPILLTSITTFASILPLLFEKSFQAQFLIPIAVTISFGLLSVTFYTLFFMPSYYYVVETILKWYRDLDSKPFEVDAKSPQQVRDIVLNK